MCGDRRLGALLQNCMKSKVLKPGKQIHAKLIATGIQTETEFFSSKLVGVYAGCGDVISAKIIFKSMQKPTIFSWNWMISASAFQGDCETAIKYFPDMQKAGVFPNRVTFSCVIKACVGLMDIKKGMELHCLIYKSGFESDVSVMNALIDMYSKCGELGFAHNVFDEMSERDVATWTCMICGYSHRGQVEKSLQLFEQMRVQGLEPNEFTWNAVITGYAQNGDYKRAYELFCKMKNGGLKPDLVTWNSMISGFTQNQQSHKALMLFKEMVDSGLQPNSVTIAGVLPSCGLIGSLERGKELHGFIYRKELGMNIFSITALIDMYSKCGYVNYALNVFDKASVRNVAAWNAMIGCYGKHGLVEESIKLFERMQKENVEANQVTFTSVLSACSHGGFVEKGLEIFMAMKENGKVELAKEHYSCVIDLLCRSGRITEAYELMKEIGNDINESIVGAFLNGCRIHGRSDFAKDMEERVLGMELKKPGGFVTLSNIYAADGKWESVESIRKLMKDKRVYKKVAISSVDNQVLVN